MSAPLRVRFVMRLLRAANRLDGSPPRDGWHSWDPHPTAHPWLTSEHLEQMRAFSSEVWNAALEYAHRSAHDHRYAFVGNLANNLYQRAVPLRKRGLDVDIVLHPHDTYAMSQPGWEEFDGTVAAGSLDLAELRSAGVELPTVDNVHVFPVTSTSTAEAAAEAAWTRSYLRLEDALRYPRYVSYAPTLDFLQGADGVLATQALYLAYMARRPYLAAPGGGDLWFECSRDDEHGRIQRLGFGQARAILASNPWTFAHARRFGFAHAIYLPFMLDDDRYSPGPGASRDDWERRTGGEFFVLCTSRLDDRYKGSAVALDGFARFSRDFPTARLVVLGWGEDESAGLERLDVAGAGEAVLRLPVSGKRRIIEYLRSADCLLDQFSLGAYGATALEAMGCGLPVVMRLELAQYEALCVGGAPPVLQATTEEEVADRLRLLASHPDERRLAAERHRAWFVRNHGASTWAHTYAAVLAATADGHFPSLNGSPLRQPLTPEERRYHEEGLRAAPEFPSYH